ncbi:hypothetical protein ACFE04_028982 [Oxalis oulophora]
MADRRDPRHQVAAGVGHEQQQQQPHHQVNSLKEKIQESRPSASKILAILALLPVGGTLLFIAGTVLTFTLIGLALATPVFIIFSPVLVPAALTIGLAVCGFMASGAFGITALSSMSWMVNYVRHMRSLPDQMEHAKKRVQDTTGQIGQKAKDIGQAIQGPAAHGKGQEATPTKT